MLRSQNVATEVNTVFQNVVELIKQIDPFKLNAVLSALAEGGVRGGQGDRIGEAITASNEVLLELNPRTDTMREDFRAIKGVSDTYSAAAKNIIDTLAAGTTTSVTVTTHAQQLDALLLNVVGGLSRSGVGLLGPSKDNLVKAVNLLEPTANLLMKYNPEITCLFVGAKTTLDSGYADMLGGNGKSLIMDAELLPGYDPYRYPDNLPIDAAKGGGEGGKPGCGSLPDVAKNFPVRQLIANTGFGTGLDWRPNPGIGFPGYANYFPDTRAVPEPPSIRYPGGPAPGPVPYPPRCTALRRTSVRPRWNAPSIQGGCRQRRHQDHTAVTAEHANLGAYPQTSEGSTAVINKVSAVVWRLGIFVVVCALGAFALITVFAQLRFEREQTYTAVFTNVSGLKSQDFVRIAGVEVGKVKNLTVRDDSTVQVEFGGRRLRGTHRRQQGRHQIRQPDRGPLPGDRGGRGRNQETAARRHDPAESHRAGTGS